jgi:uncharacterized protein (TIGR02265 family)
MGADLLDMQRRIAAATPRDTVRGLIFNSAFKVISELAGSGAAVACDPAGRGLRTDYFSYPVTDYLRVAFAAADRLERELGSVDAVFFRLGFRATYDELDSLLGKTLAAIVGRDPRRLIANAANGYHATVSYGTRTVEWLGERSARLVFRRDFLVPAFHCGVLTGAVEAMGGRDVKVSGRELAFLDSEYELSWT